MNETKPKERPIPFSTPMVRAILDGRKSQTRRVITPRNKAARGLFFGDWADSYILDKGNESWRRTAHGYAVGDVLWVREAWAVNAALNEYSGKVLARDFDRRSIGLHWLVDRNSGKPFQNGARYRQARFMPREFSRILLRVTDVRVQRVQDISQEDACAEGDPIDPRWATSRAGYRELWDTLNAKRGFGWETNPWVVALTFELANKDTDHA